MGELSTRVKADNIICYLKNAGAKEVLFVGGCVRDPILDIIPKDYDLEVYGLTYQQIIEILSKYFTDIKTVGESFGVIKVDNDIDVSVPRRDSKTGIGHKEFNIVCDPHMSIKDAAARRDYTINSLARALNGEIYNYYGGIQDLQNHKLKATSIAFKEDPLRVLRGMQFAGRFDLVLDSDTATMCREMLPEAGTLASERVFEEWWKWASKSVYPSRGLLVLEMSGWLSLYPQLSVLQAIEQDPIWHPEGNVWRHTMMVCDAAAEIAIRENLNEIDRGILVLAALCHDLGKAKTTTKNEEGRWTAPRHAEEGIALSRAFLRSIGAHEATGSRYNVINNVLPLVGEHMVHVFTKDEDVSQRVVRRLAMRLAPSNLKVWSNIVESDYSGRYPLPKGCPVAKWIKIGEELKVLDGRPEEILMGRHLIEMGLKPGPIFSKILKAAYEAQLDGLFTDLDGAKAWYAQHEEINAARRSIFT